MNDISSLTEALKQGQPLNISKNGEWYIEGKAAGWVRWIFRTEDHRIAHVANTLSKKIDQMEKAAVRFNQKNEVDFAFHVTLGDALSEAMKKHSSKIVRKAMRTFNQRLIGLKYRVEKVNGGLDRTPCSEEAFNTLLEHATEWKKGMGLYVEETLTQAEIERLTALKEFPEYLTVLENDPLLRTNFFKWCLRDNNGVRQYIEFPATCARLKVSFLAGRIGRFGPETLGIVDRKGNKGKKVMTLPFEGKQKNILNEKKVIHFRGDYSLSLKEIFKIFENKNKEVGNLEFFGSKGIMNWNPHELGFKSGDDFERVDLSQQQWWEQLPVFEELDKSQLLTRFSLSSIEEGEWVIGARGTSESMTVDFDKSHGYLTLAIPTSRGTYHCMSFGKFANWFPVTPLEQLSMVANTAPAKISYPDENEFYSHRRQAISPLKISPEEAEQLMEQIKKDIIKAQEGNIVFQFAWENCAYWPQKVMETLEDREIPEYYLGDLTECYPAKQPMRFLFNLYRDGPKWLRPYLFRLAEFLLLSFRGVWITDDNGKKIHKSVWNSPFHEKLQLYYPSLEHDRIEKGTLPGRVTFGHMELHS